MQRIVVPPKTLNESLAVTIDASLGALAADVLSGGTATCVVYSGSDPSPSAMVGSGPVVDSANMKLYLTFPGGVGVVGTIYQVVVKATFTNTQSGSSSRSYCLFLVLLPDAV